MSVGPVTTGNSGDIYLFNGAFRAQEGILSYLGITNESSRGSQLRIKSSVLESAALSGGTSNIGTNAIGDGWFVLGVTVYVTTLITASGGGASFSIGDGTDADHWGAGIVFTAGTVTTSADFTAAPGFFASAANIVLTVNTGAFTAGKVRAAIHYIDFTALLS